MPLIRIFQAANNEPRGIGRSSSCACSHRSSDTQRNALTIADKFRGFRKRYSTPTSSKAWERQHQGVRHSCSGTLIVAPPRFLPKLGTAAFQSLLPVIFLLREADFESPRCGRRCDRFQIGSTASASEIMSVLHHLLSEAAIGLNEPRQIFIPILFAEDLVSIAGLRKRAAAM